MIIYPMQDVDVDMTSTRDADGFILGVDGRQVNTLMNWKHLMMHAMLIIRENEETGKLEILDDHEGSIIRTYGVYGGDDDVEEKLESILYWEVVEADKGLNREGDGLLRTLAKMHTEWFRDARELAYAEWDKAVAAGVRKDIQGHERPVFVLQNSHVDSYSGRWRLFSSDDWDLDDLPCEREGELVSLRVSSFYSNMSVVVAPGLSQLPNGMNYEKWMDGQMRLMIIAEDREREMRRCQGCY